ncbi:MAG: methylated-DNA--[Oscillospiraceae bacterium]|nr:methylated-DNA--[protein]-cysteine S-methyltransferase [Oscillospiraceae bacterium]
MDYAVFNTPMGALKAVQDGGYLTELTYVGRYAVEVQPQTELLKELYSQLVDYFEGSLKEFTIPCKPDVTPYHKQVLEQLVQVPYGRTVTYKDLAVATGNPKAVRAVGSAMRRNPIVLLIPCHRVVKTDGSLGNYSAGGPANKEWLLAFENQNR